MSPKTKIEQQRSELNRKLSEIRSKLNAMNLVDEGDAEQRSQRDALQAEHATLETSLQDCESRYQAALIGEGDAAADRQNGREPSGETGEGAELRRLMRTATVNGYVEAALQGTTETGAEAELSAALETRRGPGYEDGIVVPWALLVPQDQPEQRAATTTAQNDGPVMQRPIIDRLFRPTDSIMDMLGVMLTSSGPGQTEFPLVSSGTGNVAQTAEDTDHADAGPMTFTLQTLKPTGRLTGSYELTAELRASVAGIEQALRRDLAMLVEEKMIEQIFVGDAVAPNVHGLLSRVAAPTTNPSAEATFADYVSLGALGVDGYFGIDETDSDILIPVDVYKHGAGIIATGTETAAIRELKMRCKRCKATAFLANAPESGGDAGINKNIIIHSAGQNGGSQRYDSLGVIWSAGPNLIVDRVTSAKKAATILTWVVVWNCFMGFRDAYQRVALKLTA